MANVCRVKADVEGREFSIETGRLAKQADGAVLAQYGETAVLVTAVVSKDSREEADFFPLTIDVEEKMYAAGKFPGGFVKRETRPGEKATLTARLIDRPLRPSFPKGFCNDVQIIITVLSADQVNSPDVLALNAASAALTISKIPFNGPIGAVRVGKIGDNWLINPTFQDIINSELDIVVAGTKEAILMVEGGAKFVPEDIALEALTRGHDAVRRIIDTQLELREEHEKINGPIEKMSFESLKINPELEKEVRVFITSRIAEAIKIKKKEESEEALSEIRKEAIEKFKDHTSLEPESSDIAYEGVAGEVEELAKKSKLLKAQVNAIFKTVEKEEFVKLVLEEKRRPDGRKTNEIRPISCEVGLLPRAHGSGLFTRGQTQVLTVLTLGTASDAQTIDNLDIEESRRFLHQYNFPPFSVGEIGFLRGPKRRDIGHGALAERALLPVIPSGEDFPYTARLVSEVLESNGSSSMASVCGSTLALMDGGVNIKAPVAGIAMGLVLKDNKFEVLTDIQGIEDHIGDMDFKVAGTAEGITAFQMDIKVPGVNKEILEAALNQAKEARLYILDKINSAIGKPREEMSAHAPRIISFKVPTDKIREIIGPGGKIIRGIIEETGVSIDIEDDGTVFIAGKDVEMSDRAKRYIDQIVEEIEVGNKYLGIVTRVTNFGAFVEITPGKEGLIHISRLSDKRVEKVEDVVNVGDKVKVEVYEVDRQNRINLTLLGLVTLNK
ncbi:MAG: polyribonucleotide nucleotidyltransferase [Actinobacteria bacterium]|nr:polyribonucleotide nucleotidyltransferase [Actinomycetota bacterium]